MSHYDAGKLVDKPEDIIDVQYSKSHDYRLSIVKKFSKNYNINYVTLDPFNPAIEKRFKDRVAIVIFYLSKIKQ